MADNQIAERHYEFHSSALASDTFTVVSISGKEGLSRPYEFAVTLVAASADIDLEAVLYKDATLKIRGGEGSGASGEYRGIVTRFEQSRKVDQYVFYEARLEPKLWLLSQTYLSEVYLERTIPQLIEEILRAGGLTSLDYEIRLSSSYRVWPYVCQYQETYLAFISRLMERDGVYYYFESGAEREKLIITDALSFQTAPELKLNYRPAADLDTHVTDDAVQALVCQQQPLPATVMVKDYNYQKAALNISQSAPVSPGGVGEVILYGENVDTQAEAERVAKLRAQEIAWHGRVFHGESTAIGMRSGVFFSLARHFRSAFNTHYLPLEISHKGSQTAVLLAGLGISGLSGEQDEPFYRNEFSAIAADVQFRPARTTPWPRMDGVMNGFIDAEGSGQYAEVDQYGRYKVQLPFDKTDKPAQKASAWIRLATPYSDPRSGMHFPLRKGAEVLLAFIDGDPDRPVIVNTVPNSDNPNMVTSGNSTQNVLYTGGGNLLWMEDQEGAQNITLRTPTQDTYIALGAVTSATQGGPPWGARGDDGTLTGNHIVINTNGNGRIRIGEYLQTLVGPNSQPPSALKNGDYFQSNSNDSTQIVGGNQQSNITGYAVTNVGPHPRQSAYGAPEAGDVQFNTQKDIALTVGNDLKTNTSGDYNITVGGDYELTVSGKCNVVFEGPVEHIVKDIDYYVYYGATTETYIAAHNENHIGLTSLNFVGNYQDMFIGGYENLKLAICLEAALAATITLKGGPEIYTNGIRVENAISRLSTQVTNIRSSINDIEDGAVRIESRINMIEDAVIHIMA